MISFNKALEFIEIIEPLGKEEVVSLSALKRVLAQDVYSKVDSPPFDSSLKDGYALCSSSINEAKEDSPVPVKVLGTRVAGDKTSFSKIVSRGEAVRIMTGALIPEGADAVLPQELTERLSDEQILCLADTSPGRNILKRGSDIKKGELVCKKGTFLTPGLLGLITGGNVSRINVYKQPKVVIIATGSELSEEGRGSASGKIFPSNRATIASWLKEFGIMPSLRLCGDDKRELLTLVEEGLKRFDVVLTSGGVLDGDRDLVVSVMEEAGVSFLFKRVKMGPGKGICMGKKDEKLVFNLPGGPPSNYIAFLFVALPAILRLMGLKMNFPPVVKATSTCFLKGRSDWTQFILSTAFLKGGSFWFKPIYEQSRLKRIALANSIVILKEGLSEINPGEQVDMALLFGCNAFF